ncbi:MULTISPECIES: 2-phosphosulfolactate phosphatase [unclassified Plantibacter]|uniref:2-phosphosulfolactate phosphatase n=1 Tax=unclassified Plantibacter TaxID=2624265 RepID=UPI003D336488
MTQPIPVHPPFSQTKYQVRFDWSSRGAGRIAPADVAVVVDVLSYSTSLELAATAGAATALDETGDPHAGAAVATALAATGAMVVAGCLRNRSAVADWIIAKQAELGRRTSIVVVAVGDVDEAGSPRFAVEDFFGAGAIIDALGARGIDYTSPEAAAAAAAFDGLRNGVGHLLSASGSAQLLAQTGDAELVQAAREVDVSTTVPVLDGGEFRA